MVIAKARQRAAAPLKVRAGYVVQRQLTVCEVPTREPPFDRLLALQQPVHRAIQVIVNRALHTQLLPQRAGIKLARTRELEPGSSTGPAIIARHRSRSREGSRSSSRA